MSENLIEIEREKASEHDFKLDNDQLLLSKENVYLAEAIFRILYKKSELESAIKKLEKEYKVEKIEYVCRKVNSENNTHLRDYERKAISKAIFKEYQTFDEFKTALIAEEYPLVKLIRRLENKEIKTKKGNKKIRDNYSFATKFCHYSCMYLFDDYKEQDQCPIYDSVIVKYVKSTSIYKEKYREEDLKNYKKFVEIIDSIKGKEISRNGFDHLVWLYNR